MAKVKRTRQKSRALVITPLGYRILELVSLGRYKFAKGRRVSAGRRQKRKKHG